MINIILNTQQHIRSFVRRQSRLTKSQKYAINNLWKTMGISYQEQQINLDSLFSRVAPVILEIGFGMGTSLVTMASSYPEKNFLGIEVHLPGIGSCLAHAKKNNIDNLRLMYYDAVEVLKNMIPDRTLELVQLFFPDPWHKVRHNKRRIIQPPFVELIGSKLVDNGIFHIATDWKPYAEHILTVISVSQYFRNISPSGDYMPRPINRPYTKFEYRGQRLGHMIWDLMFIKSININH